MSVRKATDFTGGGDDEGRLGYVESSCSSSRQRRHLIRGIEIGRTGLACITTDMEYNTRTNVLK